MNEEPRLAPTEAELRGLIGIVEPDTAVAAGFYGVCAKTTSAGRLTDASAALGAIARAVTLLRPVPVYDGSRTVAHLEQAAIRSGHTRAEISHLSGLSRERLANVVAGDPLTKDERQALRRVLLDWEG